MIDKRVLDENLKEFRRMRSLFILFAGIFAGFFNFGSIIGFSAYFAFFFGFNFLTKILLGSKSVDEFFMSNEYVNEGVMSDFFVSLKVVHSGLDHQLQLDSYTVVVKHSLLNRFLNDFQDIEIFPVKFT